MPLTAERMNQIQKEVVLGGPKSPDQDEDERDYRRGTIKDVAMMKKAGVEISFLKVDPDIESQS